MQQNFTIKSWAEDDRPREKLLLKGKSALSDAELIAIIIGSGSREKTAVELSQEILNFAENSLNKLARLTVADLMRFKGVGEAKAITITATLEVARRKSVAIEPDKKQIQTSKQAYDVVRPFLEDLQHEEFYVIAMDRANNVIRPILISKGGISGTIADGKLIFKELLDVKASACILAHNHPSGQRKASRQDIELTKRIANFGSFIDLPILDHIIITGATYFSFRDEGLL